MRAKFITLLACFFLLVNSYGQQLVKYELHVRDTMLNYTGKIRPAISVNGQTPMPTLRFTEGDTAEITVYNHMHHSTSMHWHGLLVPNEHDGVPYLTTAPIAAHGKHLFRFVLRQNGTYWYHSHTMLQEQVGMYGALIIDKKDSKQKHEEVLLLTDWSNENPHQIERSLHYATDWYMIRKNAVQSYAEAIGSGHLGTKLINELKRMHAMDVSDVYYDQFQVNGKPQLHLHDYKAGDKVRLRIINGSASTYFWLRYDGGKITVVASDGMEVKPVEVDRLIIGVSEIYDVEITIPEGHKSYAFSATSEDRIGHAAVWLGPGAMQTVDTMGRLDYFKGMKMMNGMMKLNGDMDDMGMEMSLQQMDMNAVMYPEMKRKKTGEETEPYKHEGMDYSKHEIHAGHNMPKQDSAMAAKAGSADMSNMEHDHESMTNTAANEHNHSSNASGKIVTLNYAMLQSPVPTALPDKPVRTLHFELTGNMNRYVWMLDNKTISETDKILVKAGENIRIVLTNNSMMRHPMHLHGHFFRIVNGKDDYAPLKNVLDIMPMETDTIEFNASEEYGDWFFHCHILYHMMAGMGRVFSYENSPPNPQLPDKEKAWRMVKRDDRRFFLGGEVGLESNGTDGEISVINTRWLLQTEWRLGINERKGYESETHIGRYVGSMQWLMPYVGFDWRYRKGEAGEKNWFGQSNTKDERAVFCFGVQYMLPWFINTDFRIDHTGNLRLQFSRDDIPVTKRLRLWGMYNSDNEYVVGARYILTKYISLSSHYDSDMGLGSGIAITY